MILGVGVDLIEISRVEKACRKDSFLTKCFTEAEIECIGNSPASLAGNFAVKEAVSKVLGTGFRGFWLQSVEVLRDPLGKPYVNLYKGALEQAEKMGIRNIYVSISDTKDLVTAFAVGEGEPV